MGRSDRKRRDLQKRLILIVFLGLLSIVAPLLHLRRSATPSSAAARPGAADGGALRRATAAPATTRPAPETVAAPAKTRPRSKIALCLIVLGEELHLDEFVDYHRALGVDAFFVYDNSRGFELRQWGRLKGEHVELVHFPTGASSPNPQLTAYADCGRRAVAAGDRFEWVAFFDVDEFLVLKRHDHIADMLAEHCPRGSLGVNWQIFHSDGWNLQHFEPTTRRFLYREARVNKHVKTIVRPRDIQRIKDHGDPHNFVILKNRTLMHDSNGRKITGPFNEDGPVDVAVLHHYGYRSAKEYVQKRMKGMVSMDYSRSDIIQTTKKQIQAANQSLVRALAGDHLPRDDSISKDPSLVFDDSAWRLLKRNVPAYALFDDIALLPAREHPAAAGNNTGELS